MIQVLPGLWECPDLDRTLGENLICSSHVVCSSDVQPAPHEPSLFLPKHCMAQLGPERKAQVFLWQDCQRAELQVYFSQLWTGEVSMGCALLLPAPRMLPPAPESGVNAVCTAHSDYLCNACNLRVVNQWHIYSWTIICIVTKFPPKISFRMLEWKDHKMN